MVHQGGSLRIGMISYYLPTGSKIGVGYQVDALARTMVRRGHQVDVITECPDAADLPYRTRQVPLVGGLRTFRFAMALRSLDLDGYDVIHAHGDDYWLWRRRTGAHVRTLHGSCFSEALHIHGLKERTRMALLGASEVVSTAVADATVAVSPGTRRWTPWVRRVVPNGVDLDHFHPDESQRASNPVVLFVGTWGGRKRGAALAEAFTRVVKRQHPSAELWMVTRDAPGRLPYGVKSLGRVSHDELANLYRRAWLFCLPSSYEGFGIPYVEALASGTPVVATPNVGSRYVLRNDAGVITPLGRLGPTVATLLADGRRRAELTAAGLVRSKDFSLESVAAQYEDLYRELLRAERRRSMNRSGLRALLRPARHSPVRPAPSLANPPKES